ncbi:MAG: sugar phosphate isomerase/epimerase [Candidatus Devosia symbiotica]|nr:sugar phosphate isomerase/epimerase [Candidatus Devosia symbiotica]
MDGKIQAFPWEHWRDEFAAAAAIGLGVMEWTLDHDRLADNPLMKIDGRARIAALSEQHGLSVASLTGDIFMQAPFWKAEGGARQELLGEFDAVVRACAQAAIRLIVVPLVDNGRLEDTDQTSVLLEALLARRQSLSDQGVAIIFESDFGPDALAAFIASLPAPIFGINYDIGNSAARGHDPVAELDAYASRVLNVHVKDRLLGGTTVPLGTGAARLPAAIAAIQRSGYRGRYILQTARASDGDHQGVLLRYKNMVFDYLDACDES